MAGRPFILPQVLLRNVNGMSFALKVRNDFLGARSVARAFAIDSVQYVGHRRLGVSISLPLLGRRMDDFYFSESCITIVNVGISDL